MIQSWKSINKSNILVRQNFRNESYIMKTKNKFFVKLLFYTQSSRDSWDNSRGVSNSGVLLPSQGTTEGGVHIRHTCWIISSQKPEAPSVSLLQEESSLTQPPSIASQDSLSGFWLRNLRPGHRAGTPTGGTGIPNVSWPLCDTTSTSN